VPAEPGRATRPEGWKQLATEPGQGAWPQVGAIEQVGQDVVAVQFQQGRQVHQHSQVRQEGKLPAQGDQQRLGDQERQERRGPGEHDVVEGPGQAHQDPLAPRAQPHVRGVHERDRPEPVPADTDRPD
jgi:hypothetical protein